MKIEPVMQQLETSERVEKERQVPLFEPPAATEVPPLSLLEDPPPRTAQYSEGALDAMSRLVELKLRDFGVEVEVVSVHPGPVVTRFELQPAPGVKVSQISNLSKDLARALSAISVRVVEVIPGKSVVGIEIRNEHREIVNFREVLASKGLRPTPCTYLSRKAEDVEAPDVELAGVVITPDLRVATLRVKGEEASLLALEGQPLEGDFGSWRVSRVEPRSAVLESASGDQVRLELQIHDAIIDEPPKPRPARLGPFLTKILVLISRDMRLRTSKFLECIMAVC